MKQIVLTIFSLLIMNTISAQNKMLVAYFSATGTTKNVATELAIDANTEGGSVSNGSEESLSSYSGGNGGGFGPGGGGGFPGGGRPGGW